MSGLQSQMRRRDVEMVPVVLVRSMFGVMVAALALTSFAVLSGRPLVGVVPPSAAAAEISVRLVDQGAGVIAALNPEGTIIARSDENRAGFLGVMQRVVATERERHGLTNEAPIRVVRREDGRIELIDDTTAWHVDLMGNGRDNVAAFARLVP